MKPKSNGEATVTVEEPKRILMSEQTQAIHAIEHTGLTNEHTANAFNKEVPFTSAAELDEKQSQIDSNLFDILLKSNPEAMRLYKAGVKNVRGMFSEPAEVSRMRALYASMDKPNPLQYIRYNSESKRWERDADAIERDIVRGKLRIFAESEQEIKRYNAAKNLADWINENVGAASYSSHFRNEMVDLVKGKFVPSISFVKNFNYRKQS